MPVIPVGDWIPDAADLGNPGSVRAENVFPGLTSYKPIPSFVAASNALDARPRGAISALDNSLVTHLYAGDAGKLYSLSGSTWSDVSLSGGYTTTAEERWEFVRWKNKILATNFSNNPQSITMGGANFANLTTDFKARCIAVVRDFVVCANTTESGDGAQIDRIRWSGFNNETSWAVSSITGADIRNLNIGGQIQRVFGGEYGVILSQHSTWRMTYRGAPTWFQIDEVLPGIGAIAPGAAAQLGNDVYFLSENGFVQLVGGQQAAYIGAGRVDQTVLADLDTDNLHRMSAVVDPQGNRVIFAYPGAGNTAGRPNKLVIYDRGLDKWSHASMQAELLWQASGVATTLEELDSVSSSIDALETSLDSGRWKGGSPAFAAFDSDFKHGFFSGMPMTAVVETREFEPNPQLRTTLTKVRPLVDGGSVSARVGVRSDPTAEHVWKDAGALRDGGRMGVRASGRYMRAELTLSGDWSDAVGIAFDQADARPSGRRG